MNKKLKHTAIVLMGLTMGMTAMAGEHSKRGELYGGPVVMQLDLDGATSKATAIGGSVGVNVKTSSIGTFSLDSFFSRTVDAALGENNARVDVNNAALYLAYRSPKKVFGIAKVGVLLSNLSGNSEVFKDNKTGFAATLGAGVEILNGIDLEASYTHSPDKLDVTTLSLIFSQ